MDAGSIPASSTIYQNPNPYRLGFFLPVSPVLARFRKPVPILLGIFLATIANHALAATVGSVAGTFFDGPWMNLGVDVHARHMTPTRLQPGVGLRPLAERPEVTALLPRLYAALYDSIAAHSRQGLNVVVDVGHYGMEPSSPGVLQDCAGRLLGLPVLMVGVLCSIEVIMPGNIAMSGTGTAFEIDCGPSCTFRK